MLSNVCLLFRYQTTSGILVINSGPASHAIARLPLGNVIVEVLVSDSLGAFTAQRLQVQVGCNKVVITRALSEMLLPVEALILKHQLVYACMPCLCLCSEAAF